MRMITSKNDISGNVQNDIFVNIWQYPHNNGT